VPPFTVNPHRFDPYKNVKFRVLWDGKVIAGISRVSALRRWTEVVVHREGADPSLQRRSPGLSAFDPIVLERGITHDAEFEAWADRVWKLGAPVGQEVRLKSYRKDVRIELLNEAGQVVRAYHVFRCWPSEYQALPDLDATDPTAVAIERLTLQHEGWQRDEAVPEPVEP
jgi:phage tail-like protein